jgi:citrate lyase beta subunit
MPQAALILKTSGHFVLCAHDVARSSGVLEGLMIKQIDLSDHIEAFDSPHGQFAFFKFVHARRSPGRPAVALYQRF